MDAAEPVHLCENIGPAERAMRTRVGVIGSALTLLAGAAMIEVHAPWPLRALLFLPASVAAFGFFQARAHTCVAFVRSNIKVMGDSRSDRVDVTDPAEKAAFQKKARMIYAQGLAAAAVVTGLFLLLP